MESVNAIYDGNTIKFLEPVPVIGEYAVKVIFERPLDDRTKRREELLSLAGSCDNGVVEILKEMEEERKHFEHIEDLKTVN